MYSKAFTLVELLVTITILGILATISVAVFAEYRRKAYDAVALSELHSLQNSVQLIHTYSLSPVHDFIFQMAPNPSVGGGTTHCSTSGIEPACSGSSMEDIEKYLGHNHNEYVYATLSKVNSSVGYRINTYHCKGSFQNTVDGLEPQGFHYGNLPEVIKVTYPSTYSCS